MSAQINLNTHCFSSSFFFAMANYFVKLRFLVDHGYDLLFQFKEPGAEVPPSLKEFPLVIRKNQRYIKVPVLSYCVSLTSSHRHLLSRWTLTRTRNPRLKTRTISS